MISLRRAVAEDADAIAAVHVASWHQGYDAIVPSAMSEGVTLERRTAMWQVLLSMHAETHLTLVAVTDGGRVVGFATASVGGTAIDGFDAEFHMVFLAPDHQRRDIGRRLVQTLSLVLLERGAIAAIGWVLVSTVACGFATGLGGRELSRSSLNVPGGTVTQVLYALPPLAALASAVTS
ncbi:MAG TPA: GNAT family N-acetyltransferase [Stellaceae bacterium]|nr:GNAT family N-acetyltransferase [Stellaceae bacterium]